MRTKYNDKEKQLAIDFAIWCNENYIYCEDKFPDIWYDFKGNAEFNSSEDVFEKFIQA